MPKRCVVYGCKNGYDSTLKESRANGKKGPSLFLPKKEQLEVWRKNIPVAPEKLHTKSPVCELHFDKKFILDKHIIKIGDKVIEEEREKKVLTPDAIPTIFLGCPAYLSSQLPKKRKNTNRQELPHTSAKRARRETNEETEHDGDGDGENTMTQDFETTDTSFSSSLHNDPKQIKLPNSMWACVSNETSTVFVCLTNNIQVEKSVVFSKLTELHPLVTVNNVKIKIEKEVNSAEAVAAFLKEVSDLKSCPGSGINDTRSMKCLGIVHCLASGAPAARCMHCTKKRTAMVKERRRPTKKKKNNVTQIRTVRDKVRNLTKKVQKLEDKVQQLMKKYDDLKENQIKDILDKLPPRQQEAVKACIAAAKTKTPNGNRYTQQWIYECALLRIKSGCLYRKMLRDKTIALPSLRTLQRYLKKIQPSYGFIPSTFELLAKKSAEMKEDEKHGCLLFDEMSMDAALSFNKSRLKVEGVVQLGDHTPEELKNKAGDHGLVFMFKPFKGQWYQTIGAFLSKGAVDGPVLSKLCLEATALIEKAGFKVDMWVCDGAPWNRVMWTEMGMKNPFAYKRPSRAKKNANKKEDNISENQIRDPVGLPHPCDSTRKIYMCSDFPHLIKRLKARVCPNEKGATRDLKTPDGLVKFSHWKAVVDADSEKDIQVCYKLTRDHLYPHNYQTMNVGMAFSFFSKDVADAMQHYKDQGVKELADSAPTIAFIRRVNDLIDAMNANTPWDSIQKDSDSVTPPPEENSGQNQKQFKPKKSAREIIESFIDYLIKWHKIPGKVAEKIPSQTHFGLYVTLCSAIELSNYLINEIGFKYVMTRRMNQDALEHFFGAVRQACGCNTHPDPVQFIQVYRLLSVASLVKPPRGSNISGGEMLKALLDTNDVIAAKDKERQVQFEKELDSLLDEGEEIEAVEELLEKEDDIDEKALRMFCGYVARKARRATVAKKCEECFKGLQNPESTHEDNSLIELKSNGHLLKPSEPLYNLVYKLETIIVRTLKECELQEDILGVVITNAQQHNFSEVGCGTHKRDLTKAIMRFYLTTRMIFACKKFNKKKNEEADRRKRIKSLVKQLHVIPDQ